MPVNNTQYLGKYVIARISSSDARAASVAVVQQQLELTVLSSVGADAVQSQS